MEGDSQSQQAAVPGARPVALHVDDADAYYREWSAKVDVLRAPEDEEWGARTFDLLDPSGNTIFVTGPVGRTDQPEKPIRKNRSG